MSDPFQDSDSSFAARLQATYPKWVRGDVVIVMGHTMVVCGYDGRCVLVRGCLGVAGGPPYQVGDKVTPIDISLVKDCHPPQTIDLVALGY